jgi:hypothetical protein
MGDDEKGPGMGAKLCFIDTETTSLRPDRRAWEVGIIARVPVTVKHPDSPDTFETEDREHRWFVTADDLDLGNADAMALKIGRFHDRHPQYEFGGGGLMHTKDEADVMREVEAVTRGAHLVGAVVSFDAEVLSARMRAHGICPSWHYHLCCVENLAVGYLSAHAEMLARREPHEIPGPERGSALREVASPPWKSDDLSAALGVKVSEEDRHTALGDAKWARAIYDAVMGDG